MTKPRNWLGYRTRAHLGHQLYLIGYAMTRIYLVREHLWHRVCLIACARPVLYRLRDHKRLWALEWWSRAGNRWSTP
jgi:hypothetical protein